MTRTTLNLPFKKRLHLELVQRRGDSDVEPLIPNLEQVLRAKKGNKISRFFRHIFEHKMIRKLFGANIALVIAATTIMPNNSYGFDSDYEENVVAQKAVVLQTQTGIQYPLEIVKISQGYKFYHPGIDLDGITGEIVRPIMGGRVTAIQYSRYAYGNAVLVDHGSSITSLYAHLSRINVERDQVVNLDTKIGEVGATGQASGDHLHLEVHDNGIPLNPLTILPK